MAACVRANVPVLTVGSAGIGKTATINAWGTGWGRHVETVLGSTREATDFLGLPIERGDRVHYATPAWAYRVAEAPKGLLFLGELTTTSPSVMKGMLRVIEERWVGELHLPDTVSIIADANPPDEAVDGYELAGPVANRFIHLPWRFDPDTWRTGLVIGFENLPAPDLHVLSDDPTGRYIDEAMRVAAFTRADPTRLDPGPPRNGTGRDAPVDPVKASGPWPSPRSWHKAVRALAHLAETDEPARKMILDGAVGREAAAAYLTWLRNADLIDPRAALSNPDVIPWRTVRIDQLFTLVHAAAALVHATPTQPLFDQAMNLYTVIAEHQRPDVALPGVQSIIRHTDLLTGGVGSKAREVFTPLLRRAGTIA